MDMKKKAVMAVALALAALGLAWYGTVWYLDARRVRADRRASECLVRYDRIVGDGRAEIPAEKLAPVLEELAALARICSPDCAEQIFYRSLDGAFLIGDYARAERMIDDVPGKSAGWKAGTKAKIRAHAALARGDKAAAVGEFDAFCRMLLEQPADSVESDPYSGAEWSREALLARNYKRMGELCGEIGDKARAAKLLADARAYAKTAVEKAKDDPESLQDIRRELGSLLDK